MASREDLLVELVDGTGTAIGACSVGDAHTPPGQRHRAFSVLLYDRDGRVLLQQRAAAKTRFASCWSNTCCGHPAPGENVVAAAARRLTAELGITPGQTTPLTEVGVHDYQAADPGSGLVESEWDHVLLATLTGGTPAPDAAEVSDCAWVSPAGLRASLARTPDRYTPWLAGVLDIATEARDRAPAL